MLWGRLAMGAVECFFVRGFLWVVSCNRRGGLLGVVWGCKTQPPWGALWGRGGHSGTNQIILLSRETVTFGNSSFFYLMKLQYLFEKEKKKLKKEKKNSTMWLNITICIINILNNQNYCIIYG